MLRQLLSFEFRKKLPQEFGGERIYVTGRADARVLKPGWDGAALDLQLITRTLVQPGMCVWDIGANQGILSFLAASKVGAEGAVYALEADPRYADQIFRSGLRLSPAYRPVTVLCAAISDSRDVLEFAISAKGHARNRLVQEGDDRSGFAAVKSVIALTGDDLLERWRAPDVIKMDVEGAELAALRGCERVLSEARPVLYLEVSERTREDVTALLRGHGYQIFHLEGDGSETPVETCTFYTIARPGVA